MIKNSFLLAFLATGSLFVSKINKEEIISLFMWDEEEMSAFISQYVNNSFKTKEDNVDGIVPVRFTHTSMRKIVDCEVASKGIGYGLEKSALKVLKAMPNWIPGKVRRYEFAVYHTIPNRFIIK